MCIRWWRQNYAEPITGDKADTPSTTERFPACCRVLDPHSNFYDPKAYARLREDQRGHYYGVGMVIQQQGNQGLVITPYEDTPSFRAGIHPGDIISAVDGKAPTAGRQTWWRKR
jgi:carboxyl-terminal processing protease